MVDSFLQPESVSVRVRAIGIVAPHAGYIYSGSIAGAVYARVQVPPRVIILCPNHTGFGPPLSIMRSGEWETPLGRLQIDSEMCDSLMALNPELEEDFKAHRYEHGLEVQLPFLQQISGDKTRLAPITVGTGSWERLEKLGVTIAKSVEAMDSTTLVIASSDMNHYESDAVTRVKDARAIDRILMRDPKGLCERVQGENISMCGFGPAAAMLVAANLLGASKVDLVKYATSGDVSGDYASVVGYAGLIVS